MAQHNSWNSLEISVVAPSSRTSVDEASGDFASQQHEAVELQDFNLINKAVERWQQSQHHTNEQLVSPSHSPKPPSYPSPPAYNENERHGRPPSYAERRSQEQAARQADSGAGHSKERPWVWGVVLVVVVIAVVVFGMMAVVDKIASDTRKGKKPCGNIVGYDDCF